MKKLILTGLVAAAALLFGAAPAKAQTICDFNVPFSVDSGGNPVQGASGSYHVIVTQSGAVYTVTVTGNNDGNPPTGPEGSIAPPGPVPKSGVGSLSFNFHAQGGGNIVVNGVAGATNAYVGPVDGNLGGPNNNRFGATGGAYTVISGGTTLNYLTGNEAAYVAPHGGNTFTGTFTLDPTKTLAGMSASLQDSGQQYTADCILIPEPATAALALPTLLPLGLLMLRRRRKSADVVAEEPTV